MKTAILILLTSLMCHISFGQNKIDAEKLVDEGITLHDKGDYDAAISKYDKALELDKYNLYALAEKAYSLFSLNKMEEAILYCQKAIVAHPNNEDLYSVYVTYGNATDRLQSSDKAIEIYDEGIRLYPDFYLLHFNKGVSLTILGKNDEALLSFQEAVILNPNHASSHNAIARISNQNKNRIPSLLAYCRFLSLEPQSTRAKENLSSIQQIMNDNIEKTGRKSVTINLNSNLFADTTENGKPNENNFSSADLILSLSAALDTDKKNIKKTEVEQFIRKFKLVCSTLDETQTENFGFFWDNYVPYFIEMNEKNLVETFAYIVYASSDFPDVKKWLDTHQNEIDLFYEWSDSFE